MTKMKAVNPVNKEARITAQPAEGRAAWRWAMLGGVFFIASCSQVPDAINPAEWYKSVEEAIAGDDEGASEDTTDETASGPQPIKNEGVEAPEVAKNADRPNGGLVADTEGRQYADEVALQGSAQNALAPDDGASLAEAAVAPAPPAQPVPGVNASRIPTPAGQAPALPSMPSMAQNQAGQAMPTSPQLVIEDATQAAYQQRLDAMRARLANSGVASTTPYMNAPKGQSYEELVGNGPETIIVSGEGVEMVSSGQAFNVMPQGMGYNSSIAIAPTGPAPDGTRVATILFPNGSSELSSRDRNILRQVAALLDERGGRLQVVGHSSSRTRNMAPERHQAVNLGLSVKRADQVVNELRRIGVDDDSLIAAARGDAQPVYYEIMPSGEAGNRRAEIYLIN